MKTIHFENNANSSQDIQKVKDAVFQAIMNGESFELVSDELNGDTYTHSVDVLVEHSETEAV